MTNGEIAGGTRQCLMFYKSNMRETTDTPKMTMQASQFCGGRSRQPVSAHGAANGSCALTSEFTGLRGFLRRSGGMMG